MNKWAALFMAIYFVMGGSFAALAQDETRPDGAILLTAPLPGISDQNPAFSPDATQLIFTRWENGYNEGPSGVYLLHLDTRDTELLTTAPDSDSVNLPGTSWNAPTGRIAFSSDREDIDEVWTMDEDGGNLFRVTTHDPPTHFSEPSFSPEGTWIVFEENRDSEAGEGQSILWKIRADGSDLTPLSNNPNFDDRQPMWAPAGDRILFQRRQPGSDNWDIYTMDPDGDDIQQVTTSPASDTDAAWSPDGRWIVYSSDDGGLETPSLFIIHIDGGQSLQVTDDEQHYDGAPSWSPDGAWIAFESHVGEDDVPTQLWMIAAPPVRDALD